MHSSDRIRSTMQGILFCPLSLQLLFIFYFDLFSFTCAERRRESIYRLLVKTSAELLDELKPTGRNDFVFDDNVKTISGGHARVPMLKSRSDEIKRPKKSLVRMAACREGDTAIEHLVQTIRGASNCVQSGKRARTYKISDSTSSQDGNSSDATLAPKSSSKERKGSSSKKKNSKSKKNQKTTAVNDTETAAKVTPAQSAEVASKHSKSKQSTKNKKKSSKSSSSVFKTTTNEPNNAKGISFEAPTATRKRSSPKKIESAKTEKKAGTRSKSLKAEKNSLKSKKSKPSNKRKKKQMSSTSKSLSKLAQTQEPGRSLAPSSTSVPTYSVAPSTLTLAPSTTFGVGNIADAPFPALPDVPTVSPANSETNAPVTTSTETPVSSDGSPTSAPVSGTTTAPAVAGTTPAPTSTISTTTDAPVAAGTAEVAVATVAPVGSGSTTSQPSSSSESTTVPSFTALPFTISPSVEGSGGDEQTASPSIAGTSDKNTSAPTVPGQTLAPSVADGDTRSPSMDQATAAPTAEGSIAATNSPTTATVQVNPFSILFEAESEPTKDDLLEAGDVVLTYLDDFFLVLFDSIAETELISTGGSVTETTIVPPTAIFDLVLLFTEQSQSVPDEGETIELLLGAFQAPFIDELLIMLASELPVENPLSTTSSVVFELLR